VCVYHQYIKILSAYVRHGSGRSKGGTKPVSHNRCAWLWTSNSKKNVGLAGTGLGLKADVIRKQ